MSKQTKYKDADDVKMEIKRTEVARTRAKFEMLDHQKKANQCFAIVHSLDGKPLTEAMKEIYHTNLKLAQEIREAETKASRQMSRAELKLERLKKALGIAQAECFAFVEDQGVVV